MPENRTPIKKGSRPKFGINEVVYVRESAIRGFVEPIAIAAIRYEPNINSYVYSFLKNKILSNLIIQDGKVIVQRMRPAKPQEISPIEVREEELITICEALEIQVRYLENQLELANAEFERVCNSVGSDLPEANDPDIIDNFIISPQEPRFGINDVVYLIETAQSVGRLEKVRIDAVEFDVSLQKWVYTSHFQQKPGENMTVGDRIDLKESVVLRHTEDDLVTVCEAIPIRIDFLEQSLLRSTNLRDSVCGSGD